MEAPKHFFEALLFFISGYMTYVPQDSILDVHGVMERIITAHETYDPIQYQAEMWFKGLESDTFDAVRYCTISYKANPDNSVYGYDWKHEETIAKKGKYTLMALPEGMYYIFRDDSLKEITHTVPPTQINLGVYEEIMRNYFVLDQVLQPFYVPAEEITLVDSSDYYLLSRKTNEIATNIVTISKETFLPVRSTTLIHDPELDLRQTIDIHFSYDIHKLIEPDSIFSINPYLNAGYTYTFVEKKETPIEKSSVVFKPIQWKFLLNYPLLSDQEDTLKLRNALGGYLLLDFWFTSCIPCMKAMPELDSIALTYADSVLQVLGINCFDKVSRAIITPQFRAQNIAIPLLFCERNLVDALAIQKFPSYYLITPDQKVIYIDGDIHDVKKVLKDLLDK